MKKSSYYDKAVDEAMIDELGVEKLRDYPGEAVLIWKIVEEHKKRLNLPETLGWGTAPQPGTLMYVSNKQLRISTIYQREDIKGALKIAMEFDWSIYQPVTIVRWPNRPKEYVVTDGGRRIYATLLLGFMDRIPAYYVSGLHTLSKQADQFIRINKERKKVPKMNEFIAAVKRGDSDCVLLDALITRNGLTIFDKSGKHIGALGALLKLHGRMQHCTKRVMDLLGECEFTGSVARWILQAFYGAAYYYEDEDEWEKFKRLVFTFQQKKRFENVVPVHKLTTLMKNEPTIKKWYDQDQCSVRSVGMALRHMLAFLNHNRPAAGRLREPVIDS